MNPHLAGPRALLFGVLLLQVGDHASAPRLRAQLHPVPIESLATSSATGVPIAVDVRLRNLDSIPVTVATFLTWPGANLFFEVKGPDGRTPPARGFTWPDAVPTRLAIRQNAVRLAPGAATDARILLGATVPVARGFHFNRPGQYQVFGIVDVFDRDSPRMWRLWTDTINVLVP